MTPKCSSCSAPLRAGSLFCLKCGTRVTPPEDDIDTPRGTIFSPGGFPLRGTAPLAESRAAGTAPLAEFEAGMDAAGAAALQAKADERDDLAGERGGLAAGPDGERRIVTVLYSDISGYKAFTDRSDPETVAELANEIFRALTEAIYRNGGIVDKYMGDAIMAVFGAPIAHEDDPCRAIRAAVAMQAAAKTFSDALAARTGQRLELRIGINTGPVVAGAVSGNRKRSYTVAGEAVNVAQRMEAAAEPGNILVAHDTWLAARDEFEFAEQGEVLVRGGEAAVRAYEMVARAEEVAWSEAPSGVESGVDPGRPVGADRLPLMARDAELAELGRAWSDAQVGEPVVVYVRGAAGAGKSALLREMFGPSRLVAPAASGGPVIWVRCTPYESSDTLGIVARIARRLLGIAVATPDLELLAERVRLVAGVVADDNETAELLDLLLNGQVADTFANIGPEHRRAMIFKALAGLLVSAAKKSPIALIVDDLHWIDDGSAEFFGTLFKALAKGRARFLLAAAYRPGVRIMPTPGGTVPVRELPLKPMPQEEAQRLMEARLGKDRLGALSTPLARKAIEAAAVLAEHATAKRIATLVADPDARKAIDVLVDAAVLGEEPGQPGSLVLVDRLLQEATYTRILVRDRQRLHRGAAKLLEAEFQAPAVVAQHFARAEEAVGAADSYLLAAEHSLSLYSNHEAQRHVEAAREWGRRIQDGPRPHDFEWRELSVEAEAAAAMGNLDRAVTAAEKLVAIAPRDGDRLVGAYDRLADYLSRLGRHQDAIGRCNEGIERCNEGIGRALQLVGRRANSWIQLGDHAAAASEALGALESARPGAYQLRGFLLGCAGLAQLRLGQGAEAIRTLRAALEAQQKAGNLYGAAHCLNNLGSTTEAGGETAEARRYFNRGLQIATRIGDRRLVSMLMNNLGMLEFNRGEIPRAKECFMRALEAHREMQDRQGEGIALVNLGEVLASLGEQAEAEQYLMQAVMLLEEIGLRGVLAEAYRLLAQLKMGRERYKEALELLQRSSNLARDTGQMDLYGGQLRLLGEVYAALDRMEDALEWANRSLEVLQGITAPLEQGRTYALIAKLMAESGNIPQAQEAAREACKLFEQTGARQDQEKFNALSTLLLAGQR